MKNNLKYISSIITCILLHINLNAQDALSADRIHPTFNKNCQNGEIDLHISGGFAPYDVIWYEGIFPTDDGIIQKNVGLQGSNDGEDIMGLSAGYYNVEVKDALCGYASASYLLECACLDHCQVSAGEIRHSSCSRGGKIEIDVSCEGENGSPYSFEWNDGIRWKNRSDLNPGTYCLTVTDANGCEFENCFDVQGQKKLELVVADKQNVQRCGYIPSEGGTVCDGYIDIEIANGNGSYQYQWSNGATTQDISNLCEGFYSVTVIDEKGCTQSMDVYICCCARMHAGHELAGNCYNTVSVNNQEISIDGGVYSGAYYPYIRTNVSRGMGSNWYSCAWSGPNGFVAYDCSGLGGPLEPGKYCLTVTDGCDEETECYEIVDCDDHIITVSGEVTKTCYGVDAGSIELTVSGSEEPYDIIWSNGMTGQSIKGLASGEYCVTVYDAYGCFIEECFEVGEKEDEFWNSTNPCGRQYVCNGIETRFEAYREDCIFNDPFQCTVANCYCSLTGEYVRSYDAGYEFYDYDFNSCQIYGFCPDGSGWEWAGSGTITTFYDYIQVCTNCFECHRITACIMAGQYAILEAISVGDSNCGGPGITNPSDEKALTLASSIRISELNYLLKRDSTIPKDLILLMPEMLSDTMFIEEYSEEISKLMMNGIERVKMNIIPFDSELNSIDCSTKICVNAENSANKNDHSLLRHSLNPSLGSITPNPFSGNLSVNLSEFNPENNYSVEITISTGKVIYSKSIFEEVTTINTDDWMPGVYFSVIRKNGEILASDKIIKLNN